MASKPNELALPTPGRYFKDEGPSTQGKLPADANGSLVRPTEGLVREAVLETLEDLGALPVYFAATRYARQIPTVSWAAF